MKKIAFGEGIPGTNGRINLEGGGLTQNGTKARPDWMVAVRWGSSRNSLDFVKGTHHQPCDLRLLLALAVKQACAC